MDNIKVVNLLRTGINNYFKEETMKNKRVLILAICVILATVLFSLGWLNPAKEHGVKDVRYLSQNQWDQTIAECTEAIAADPTLATAYNNRGYAYAQKGYYNKAITDYTRAIEIDPEYARAYNNRGFAYDNYREYDKAIADYTRAVSIDPYYVTAYYNRAFAYRATGEKGRADADFLVAGYTP
jgi:tetratricopeptide (TPR) repeat protein